MLDFAAAKQDGKLLRQSPLRAELSGFSAASVMDWAQSAYPQYFPGTPPDVSRDPYLYRYYPETGNYLGVAGNAVYVIGPLTQGVLTWVGTLAGFSCAARPGCTDAPSNAAQAARFLAQATLGATTSEIANLQATTYAEWIDAQFALPHGPSRYDWLAGHGYSDEANRNVSDGIDNAIWSKLVTATDPLRQRVTLALSEILVVSVLGVNTNWRQFAVANYMDVLESEAFGNYRSLLDKVSLNTAMGSYLTFRGNAKANPMSGSEPDENYARELMQLFTIGLVNLDAQGMPTGGETYGPDDVSTLARVFTGWDSSEAHIPYGYTTDVHLRPMIQVFNRFDSGAKNFLGARIRAGTSARDNLTIALDRLFNHASLPPFLSRQLIQRLVTSNPSPGYVARVTAAFVDNGTGVRGDMKAIVKAILLDVEARDPSHALGETFGKLREPIVRFLNWARAFNATSPSGEWAIGDLSDAGTALGQSPMRSPTVFNFFRPRYVPPTSDIAAIGLVAPEFQLTTESSVAGYVNFMQLAIEGRGIGDVRADYTGLLAIAADSGALLAELNLVLAAQQIPASRIAALKTALDTIAATTDAGKRDRVLAALTLVLAAPEYIAQK